MWSLYKRKEDSGLFDYAGEKLEPLKFSNGKTQADVVKEILDAVGAGHKLIFLKGVCGTGKSAIALNLARHFKKTSIVVPIKSLQEQYEHDYTKSKYILKEDKSKLKISVIKGRNNFRCQFNGERADDSELPCTIEIKERNMEKIKEYIALNDAVSSSDFSSIDDVRRMSVAPACPYWSPLLPAKATNKILEQARKKTYDCVAGYEYALFQRKHGCGYYDQYESYFSSDVLIFNSEKYIIESTMGRKPQTDLDIIDECDEFLDDLAGEKRINLNRLLFALSNIFTNSQENKNALKALAAKVNSLLYDFSLEGIEKVKSTEVIQLVDLVLENPYLAEDDEDNYYNKVLEIAREFESFLDETYVAFTKEKSKLESEKENSIITLVTINLSQKFQELRDRCKVIVLMSGTIHSEQVLKDIFGISDFKIIEAETNAPGTILKLRTGKEVNCKMENFRNGLVTREAYFRALAACLEQAKKPTLIHVHSFEDLPTELEKSIYHLNILSREKLLELQDKDRSNSRVDSFKKGEIDVLYTTKCSRGVDFPGEQCNSIILTKYPYPNMKSFFWQILRKEHPEKSSEFYFDKARRELLQKISRGVRFKGDHVLLLSPDSRVIDARIG